MAKITRRFTSLSFYLGKLIRHVHRAIEGFVVIRLILVLIHRWIILL